MERCTYVCKKHGIPSSRSVEGNWQLAISNILSITLTIHQKSISSHALSYHGQLDVFMIRPPFHAPSNLWKVASHESMMTNRGIDWMREKKGVQVQCTENPRQNRLGKGLRGTRSYFYTCRYLIAWAKRDTMERCDWANDCESAPDDNFCFGQAHLSFDNFLVGPFRFHHKNNWFEG